MANNPFSDFSALKSLKLRHSVGSSKSKPVVEDRPAPVSKATEIDLHIEALPGGLGVPKGKELPYQLEHFKSVMRSQLKHRGSRVIFVHGVGDGILKQAIRTELDTTYALSCTWNPYGDGATAVTVNYPKAKDTSGFSRPKNIK